MIIRIRVRHLRKNYIMETNSSRKESSFSAEVPLIKSKGGIGRLICSPSWSADSSKISSLVPQEHQIRMYSDERDQAMQTRKTFSIA